MSYLELQYNLVVNGVQILYSDVLQSVLQSIEGCWDGQFPTVALENGIVDLLEQNSCRGRRSKGPRNLVYGKGHGNGELDEFGEEYSSGCEIPVVAARRHHSRIVRNEGHGRILERQLASHEC